MESGYAKELLYFMIMDHNHPQLSHGGIAFML